MKMMKYDRSRLSTVPKLRFLAGPVSLLDENQLAAPKTIVIFFLIVAKLCDTCVSAFREDFVIVSVAGVTGEPGWLEVKDDPPLAA